MKYVIVRCEDAASGGDRVAALLDGSKTAHLHQLAQAGSAGVIRQAANHGPVDRLLLRQALIGLDPYDPEAAPGRAYAAAANVQLKPGDAAWCCEFVTQRDGLIIDPTAGRITTKESELLIHALDKQLGAQTRRWQIGQGSHHLVITRDPALEPEGCREIRSPALMVDQAWTRQLPSGQTGEALRALLGQAAQVLEAHPVNRVRVDLGENPANMVWLWGPARAGSSRTFTERTGLSGAVTSNSFFMRGISKTFGLKWAEGPASFEEPALRRWLKTAASLVEAHELVYMHLQIETADPVERLCAMERIDQLLLKPLTERLPSLASWRLLSAIDDRKSGVIPFVAIGTGLPQQPIAQLTSEAFAGSPLQLESGSRLFEWFTATG